MALLDPKLDLVFKLLLTRAPAGNELLRSMLESVLNLPAPIETLEVRPSRRSAAGETLLTAKEVEFDIWLTLRSGEKAVVEIQLRKHANFRERLLFYWSRIYATDLRASDGYTRLNRAYVITWINDTIFDGRAPRSCFRAYDPETKRILSSHFEIHTIELPKLVKMIKLAKRGQPHNVAALAKLTAARPGLVRWGRFLVAKTREEFETLALEDPIMKTAKQTLEMISSDPEVQRLAYERETYLIAQRDNEARSWEEGREEGRTEGESVGLIKGESIGRVKSQRQTLLKLLERRFGAVPPAAYETIDHASSEQLSQWTLGIFEATSVEELLKDG